MAANLRVLERINVQKQDLAATEQDYQRICLLSDTANGDLKGRPKLAFEQYVQAIYFNQVIAEANQRFSYMTGGRFILVRKEEPGNLGSKLVWSWMSSTIIPARSAASRPCRGANL